MLCLYTILGITFIIQKASEAGEESAVYVDGKKIEQEQEEEAELSNQEKSVKKVAITFDDGPHPIVTEQILDGLKERGVKATFFITGAHAEEYPDIVKRIYEEGHTIGNHTYSHIQLTKDNKEEFAEELRETSEIIEEITGQETIFVRPPYGEWNKELEKELNMFPVLWTVDPLDWCSDDVSAIVRRVISKTEDNDIILLHDEYETTRRAAFVIIDELQKKGYEFVTVEEILFN